jgi:hypothetical protein
MQAACRGLEAARGWPAWAEPAPVQGFDAGRALRGRPISVARVPPHRANRCNVSPGESFNTVEAQCRHVLRRRESVTLGGRTGLPWTYSWGARSSAELSPAQLGKEV